MKVILQEKVANLGNVGDQVKVKSGYARNFLIPFDKALFATEENIAAFEARRADLEKRAKEILHAAEKHAEALLKLEIILAGMASEEGKLYGSIGPRDIAEAISKAGVPVEKRQVSLPQGPIRTIGEYEIGVHLHSDVKTKIKITVNAEK